MARHRGKSVLRKSTCTKTVEMWNESSGAHSRGRPLQGEAGTVEVVAASSPSWSLGGDESGG